MSRPDSINDENKQGDGGNATVPISTHSRSWSRRAGRTPLGTKAK